MKTKIYQNEHGVWVLEIYNARDKLLHEMYSENDETVLYKVAEIVKDMYWEGFSDGKYGV